MIKQIKNLLIMTGLISGLFQTLPASKLVEMKVVDKDYLMLHFIDGEVKFVDDANGEYAYDGGNYSSDNSYAVYYGDELDVTNATTVNNWVIKSDNDSNYGTAGVNPEVCYRKSKINGMSMGDWAASDWNFDYTNEHFIYLCMPYPMEEGKNYTVEINENLNADTTNQSITYDIFQCPSEAIHTNLVGYMSNSRAKSADLYHFLGDGGNRDYSEFVGNNVYLYNVESETYETLGSVAFWMNSKTETNHNLTGSDVWNIDFNNYVQSGTYRLAVEGIGCSEDFEIKDDIYHDPFKIAIMGYFYMRIGQDNMDMTPVPRRPLYIPGQNPANCTIYITDMDPYHSQWETFASGDQWDKPGNWSLYKKEGEPTNSKAVGGHSDAQDWDRHLGHVVNVYDLCLAYILSDGTLDDDDLRIAESGNGIPDILDEARNEVDFWLKLRYEGGYSHGLTNPDGNNNMYQADNTPMAAWANSLNTAMLAYCFQISGHSELREEYLDSALIAYNYANNLDDQMLDTKMEGIRGVDFKMMTAAYLYNLTGETQYEDIMKEECEVTDGSSSISQLNSYDQLWGVAAYLLTKRTVNYPDLQANMKSSIVAKAKSKEADYISTRPSRRGYSSKEAYWQTAQDMPRAVLAHAVAESDVDKLYFLDALLMEADWGLGRNPLNMIQMTTASTELAEKRSIENCYTSGRNDGTPGMHPGHTPYLNIDSWGGAMVGSNPKKVLAKFYPDISNWGHAAKYIDTRFVWTHSEFTPRQTMKGKTLIYAYLYSLSKSGGSVSVLIADAGDDQTITDENEDGKEVVELDGSGSYSNDSEIVNYTWKMENSEIAQGQKTTVELDTGNYQIVLEVEDANGNSAIDSVNIKIVAQSTSLEADYDFETDAQFDQWYVENFTTTGGSPTAIQSSEIVHGGEYSLKLKANYIAGSEHSLRMDNSLENDVTALVYYVWVPQVLVDSATIVYENNSEESGGIQNYLMHNGWQWVSEWYGFEELNGDAWNKVVLTIPDNVINSTVQSFGISFKTNAVNVGESNVYIDDIYFEREDTPEAIEEANIPSEFILSDNYPNPFNPTTKIRYNIPEKVNVKMSIYDIAGHKVRTLVDREQNSGTYEIIFDASDISSGVYLYTLEAGNYRNMKKMILLK